MGFFVVREKLEEAASPRAQEAIHQVERIQELTETAPGHFEDAWKKLELLKDLVSALSAEELAEVVVALKSTGTDAASGTYNPKTLAERMALQDALTEAVGKIMGEEPQDVAAAQRMAEQLKTSYETAARIAGRGEAQIIEQNQQLAAANSELNERTGHLQEALRSAKEQLAGKGRGMVYPSCFRNIDGKPEYIFDIEFNAADMILREVDLPHRMEEKASLPFSVVTTNAPIGAAQYLAETTALYEWSVKNECRFFVRISDNTDAVDKQAYKRMKTAIEGHFYVFEPALYTPFAARPDKANIL